MLAAVSDRLFGPMLGREMASVARRRWFRRLRLILAIVLSLGAAAPLLQPAWESFDRRALPRLTEQSFNWLIGLEFVAVWLLGPALLCGTIAAEREAGTLDLLFTTQLSNREIVFGKLVSRLAAFALFALVPVPIISLLQLFGGIDAVRLALLQADIAIANLFVGSFALFASAISRSMLAALVRCYVWLGLLVLALPLATAMSVMALREGAFAMLALQLAINPVMHFGVTMSLDDLRRGPTWPPELYFALICYLAGFVVMPAISAVLVRMAVLRLREPPALAKPRTVKQPIADATDAAPTRPVSATVHELPKLFGVFAIENPLWRRSRVTPVYDREGVLRRAQWIGAMVFICFLLIAGCNFRGHYTSSEAWVFLCVLFIGLFGLTALVAATSFLGERRRGFLPHLLVTPIESATVVDGVCLSVWEHVKGTHGFALAMAAVVFLPASDMKRGLVPMLLIVGLLSYTIVLLGVAASLAAQHLVGAVAVTGALTWGAAFGPWPFVGEEVRAVLLPLAGILAVASLILGGPFGGVEQTNPGAKVPRRLSLRSVAHGVIVASVSLALVVGWYLDVARSGFVESIAFFSALVWISHCLVWRWPRAETVGLFCFAVQQCCVAWPVGLVSIFLGNPATTATPYNVPSEALLGGGWWMWWLVSTGDRSGRTPGDWPFLVYIVGVAAALVILRTWLIGNFDRLAGRMPGMMPSRPTAPFASDAAHKAKPRT